MKHFFISLRLRTIMLFFFCAVIMHNHLIYASCSTPTQSDQRSWNLTATTLQTSQSIQSSLVALMVLITQDYAGTFTTIAAISNTVSTINSKVDSSANAANALYLKTQTIVSKVNMINNTTITLSATVDVMHVNDFGGTWTALNNLDATLTQNFQTNFNSLLTVESKIDKLSTDNATQFVVTFTQLQVVSAEVFSTMTQSQSLATQIDTNLFVLDSLVDIVKRQMSTADSKIDFFDDAVIDPDFSGTFTAIDALVKQLSTVDSKILLLETFLQVSYANTFTVIQAMAKELDTVSSKVDIMNSSFSVITQKVSIIDMPW